MKTKEEYIIQAVNNLKNSEFKATAIKVELEGQLDRGEGGNCEYCDEGYNECDTCCGGGERYCRNCEGDGVISGTNDLNETIEVNCDECDGTGNVACDNGCDEGYFICGECEGDWEGSYGEFSNEDECYDYIMQRLEPHGLSERTESGGWVKKGALRFARFYNDGSVDSEFTFTLMLDDPKNIFLLPKVIGAWNELVVAVGNGISTSGAGMHIALINTKSGIYPSSNAPMHDHFRNFKKSMQLLLPALYLLASPTNASRGLGYRRPEIGYDTHRSAIDYRNAALEFRIFETTYNYPEHILDNIVVISKAMKYWTQKFKPSGVDKITPTLMFGNDGYGDINRMYGTLQHVDVLNAGLKKLKPDYQTITEVKQQRQFKVNKRFLQKQLDERKKQAEAEFKEYEERFKWSLIVTEANAKARKIESSLSMKRADVLKQMSKEQLMAEAEEYAKAEVERRKGEQQSGDFFIQNKIVEYVKSCSGQYRLTA